MTTEVPAGFTLAELADVDLAIRLGAELLLTDQGRKLLARDGAPPRRIDVATIRRFRSALAASGSKPSLPFDGWDTIPNTSWEVGISSRTIRAWAVLELIPAKKFGTTWVVHQDAVRAKHEREQRR